MSVKVVSSLFVISSPSLALCPKSDLLEFVFIGRSNVGKSSLINAIADKKQLAKTSAQPGKTQLINYFAMQTKDDGENIQSWHLVDLPGYGYAKVTREERVKRDTMITSYFQGRKQIEHVFVLIDSRIDPQKVDIEFITKLHAMNKPFSLVYTKTDKVNQKEVSNTMKAMMKALHSLNMSEPHVYYTSTEKKHATVKLVDAIHSMNTIR